MDKEYSTIPPFLSDMIILDLFDENSMITPYQNAQESQLKKSILYFYPQDADLNTRLCYAGLIHTIIRLVQTFNKDLPYFSHSIESTKKKIHILCPKDQRYVLAITIQYPCIVHPTSKSSINIDNSDTKYQHSLLKDSIGESILQSMYKVICLIYGSISDFSSSYLDHMISSVNNHFSSIIPISYEYAPTLLLSPDIAIDMVSVYEQLYSENILSFCLFYKGFLICNKNMNCIVNHLYHYFYSFDQPTYQQQQFGSFTIHIAENNLSTCSFCRNSDFLLAWICDREIVDMNSIQTKIIPRLLKFVNPLTESIRKNMLHIQTLNNYKTLPYTNPLDNTVSSICEQETGYTSSRILDNGMCTISTSKNIFVKKVKELDSIDNQGKFSNFIIHYYKVFSYIEWIIQFSTLNKLLYNLSYKSSKFYCGYTLAAIFHVEFGSLIYLSNT